MISHPIAARQVQELAKIERAGVGEMLRMTGRIRSAAVTAIRRRELPEVEDLIRGPLERSLLRTYEASYLRALRRNQLLKQNRRISLSAIDDARKGLKKFVNIPLRVQRGLETEAFNVAVGESQKINKLLRGRVADSLSKGKTQAESIKLLKRDFKKLGLSPQSDASLATTFRTQSQLAYNAARWNADKNDDDVWGYTYVTVGDDVVRPEHEELEEVTLPKQHPTWNTIWPPNGFNCRCQVVTIFIEDEPDEWIEVPPDAEGPAPEFAFNAGQVLFSLN